MYVFFTFYVFVFPLLLPFLNLAAASCTGVAFPQSTLNANMKRKIPAGTKKKECISIVSKPTAEVLTG
jgi:hypothetical protein